MININNQLFVSMKGEFEAEGIEFNNLCFEAINSRYNQIDYLVKISGCEAKSDINNLIDLGISSITCPMIETGFAMKKYMDIVDTTYFNHIGVTIETITAVENIKSILEEGNKLTNLTIGRTDLNNSYSGKGPETIQNMQHVLDVSLIAKGKNLTVTMGGSISKSTLQIFDEYPELKNLVDFIETRKFVMSLDAFLKEGTLDLALNLEQQLLDRRVEILEKSINSKKRRISEIKSRL